jgi:hypothetical protein
MTPARAAQHTPMDIFWEFPLTAPPLACQCSIAALKAGGPEPRRRCKRAVGGGPASARAPRPLCVFLVPQ